MPAAWRNGFVALAACLPAFCAAAEVCSDAERAVDMRTSLPAEIERTLPAGSGVESLAPHAIERDGTALLAAIIVPKRYLCGGGKAPESEPGVRTLTVWRKAASAWREIGSNSDIVYAAAAQAHVSLHWYGDSLSLVQYYYPSPGEAGSDNYDFIYEAASGKIRLAYRMSSSFRYPQGGWGDEYAKAEKRYGEQTCDYDGYRGEINYLSGEVSIVQCRFARREVSRSPGVKASPLYLGAMKNVHFDEIDLLKSSGPAR